MTSGKNHNHSFFANTKYCGNFSVCRAVLHSEKHNSDTYQTLVYNRVKKIKLLDKFSPPGANLTNAAQMSLFRYMLFKLIRFHKIISCKYAI